MVAPQVVTALSDPRFYPHEPATVELRETHLSLVFLAGPLAYKLKKPVVLDFVDYGNLERRRLMCAEEVRLNRRLAPDVYLGVRALCADGEGLRLAAADDPDAVEYLVEMRRYDESRTLASGSASSAEAAAVGTTLARFHAAAERADGGGPAAVKRTYDDTYETLLALDDGSRAAELVAAERFADAFIVENRALLLTRAARGLVRDGHGDLRAEHVLLEARAVEVVDCVEFDPRLREIDVGADLAFLLMDLEDRKSVV